MRHLDAIHITRLIPISHPSRLILFQGLLACWMVLITLTGPTILAQTGPQPGATDPMGNPSRYFLLRDDELFVPGVAPFDGQGNGLFYDYTYLPDVNLNLPSPVLQQGDDPEYTWDPQIWTSKGRITTPNYDQVVYARRSQSQVALFFVDRNTTKIAFSVSLGSLVDRVDGFTDFIDIAVGDLDKLADSAGVYHDEIAVVWASPGSNNNLTVNVAVLDYTDPSTDSNKAPIATVSAVASNPIDDHSASGIVALDNVLGVAVGDFDGDGKGEIAVGHLQNGTTLWITTFRYTNDGKGNRTLQQVNALSTTTNTASPYIATVSVHASDFNGDGPDEVAVGGSVVISSLSQAAGFVQFYQSDQQLKLTFASSANAFLEPKPYVQRLEVATGLFPFDPAAGDDTFNVQLLDSTGTTFSSKSTDTSDFDVGGSVEASASATYKEGGDIGVAEAEDETTVTVTANASYDYKSHQESYNSKYASRTVSFTGITDHDDYLRGRIQIFDIWRYRIYGISSTDSQGNPTNAYYELVLPGPVLDFAGGGLGFDWYQPLHENGNILSYPAQLGSTPNNPFLPGDLGGYTDTTGATVKAPMVPASQQAFDGTSGTIALQYSSTSGSGYISSYSHSLNTSIDVQVSNKTSASFFGEGGSVQTSVKTGFHDGLSFGKSSTSDQTTTNCTGITLNKPSGDPTQAYNFYPIFYITQDGTVKASHAVDILGNAAGREFWAGIYGTNPDPALNLPLRFDPVYSTATNQLIGWAPNQKSSRKQLRGFLLLDANLNPLTNSYDYLVDAPVAGDQVRIQANVYNYSTGHGVSNLLAAFQAIPYDSTSDTEAPFTSCPNTASVTNGRCAIGQTTIESLDPLQMTMATIVWDTSGFGGSTPEGSVQYRIYAVLDPNNAINETYEPENPSQTYRWVDTNGQSHNRSGIDPGQNNEGFGYATIMAPTPGPNLAAAPNVFLGKDSIAAFGARDASLRTRLARAELGQPTRLRVTVHADQSHRKFSHLLVYDGDPGHGGTVIAHKIVHSGNPGGTHVWIDWIPRTTGLHRIVAQVVEDHNDPAPGNGADVLAIRVVRRR